METVYYKEVGISLLLSHFNVVELSIWNVVDERDIYQSNQENTPMAADNNVMYKSVRFLVQMLS